MAKTPRTYIPTPAVPAAVRARYQVVLEVLAGARSMSAGAKALGLSRARFQTVRHRGLQGLLAELGPKAAGRPKSAATERALRHEAERLRRANAKLQTRVQMTDRLLEVASGLLHGRLQTTGRTARRTPKRGTSGRSGARDAGEEADGARRAGVHALRRLGMTAALAARVMGVSAATVTRWSAPRPQGRPQRSRRATPPPASAVEVCALVRRTHGLVGAEALRRSVVGVSRRQAAALKRDTLRAMEGERVRAATRITITTPGVVRGFDAMHWQQRYVLVAGDGCVPYRTSVSVSDAYDSAAVVRALEQDLASAGVPLVYRVDRAKAHETPRVRALLETAGVLLLHGPPRHPGYYGQLERQNRDHRAWLALSDQEEELSARCAAMREAMNGSWRRAALGWRTPEELWQARPVLTEDRVALRDEVRAYAAQVRGQGRVRGMPADFPERLAIERALTRRGYLRRERGGWC